MPAAEQRGAEQPGAEQPAAEQSDLFAGAGRRVSVLLPLPLDGSFDYLASEDLALAPGDLVMVPLGRREVLGVLWDDARLDAGGAEGKPQPLDRLKPIRDRLPVAPMAPAARRFLEWLANYYVALPGQVLRMMLNQSLVLAPPRRIKLYLPRDKDAWPADLRLTPARQRVLEVLAEGPGRPLGELAAAAGVGSGVVKKLESLGVLEAAVAEKRRRFPRVDWQHPGPDLNPAQEAAAAGLVAEVEAAAASVTLLDGVTGSGKTEVYFEAVAAALARGRQVLVLLPEIALSAQWLERFQARFGAVPAVWHSDLGQTERRDTWQAVARGEASVVVGARSALFLPFTALGLIVVDEEHDGSYKQEDGIAYNARDMAVVRGQIEKLPVVLASATPALESLANCERGRYRHMTLDQRHGTAGLPQVTLIDLRKDQPLRHPGVAGSAGQSWLSAALRGAVSKTLADGEQAMLFLNRRGYAPLTLCRGCGHRLKCPDCTAWLVEHRLAGRLQCHHCGFAIALPENCPSCGAADSLAACGPGIERLAEEAHRLYPDARQAIMASDTLHGPSAAAELVAAIQAREVDLLIGTQIAAKGYHFPALTLVGVIDGDLGLYGGDLRASERTFQLLQQVAGRAGRAGRPGRVLIQTTEPDHPVMLALAAGERAGFLDAEGEGRRLAGLPPFSRLAALILSHPEAAEVDAAARLLARDAPREPDLEILGPAPAPLAVLRGRHRRRFLLRAARDFPLQQRIRQWLGGRKWPSQLRLRVDIDPMSFL